MYGDKDSAQTFNAAKLGTGWDMLVEHAAANTLYLFTEI